VFEPRVAPRASPGYSSTPAAPFALESVSSQIAPRGLFCGSEEGTMTITVRPIVRNGEHYVTVTIDGGDLKPRGPFGSPDEAEIMADRLAAVCAMFRSDGPVRRLAMEGSANE
jgi:hypothetical protein